MLRTVGLIVAALVLSLAAAEAYRAGRNAQAVVTATERARAVAATTRAVAAEEAARSTQEALAATTAEVERLNAAVTDAVAQAAADRQAFGVLRHAATGADAPLAPVLKSTLDAARKRRP